MFIKIIHGFLYSLQGLHHAYQKDKSFRIETWSGLVFIVFGYLFWPLEKIELLLLILSFTLILMSELINTAFERALERLHPERHELIGATKDIASAAVFIAICFALVVAAAIALRYFNILQ